MDTNKINIAGILKEYPEGTKLWSPLFGDVTLLSVDSLIAVKTHKGYIMIFDRYGIFIDDYEECGAECLLFPSKENRDWSVLNQKNIIERIKTFDDACAELGDKHPLVNQYMLISGAYKGEEQTNDVIAYLKLRIITAVFNQGWKPNFKEEEYQYYPWFCIYSKNEYDALSKAEKEECRIIRHSDNSSNAGVAYVYSDYTVSDNSGSHLALKTRELAEYCGRQFMDIWGDYLFS